MQLHTCQTVLVLVIPEEWSTEGNAFKCIFVSWLSWPKETGILWGGLPQRCNPQVLVLDKPIIDFKESIIKDTSCLVFV